MLATKANTRFDPPVRDEHGVDKYEAHFFFEYQGKLNECKSEAMVAPSLYPGDERIQNDLVETINNLLCEKYPYEELMTIKPAEPRAAAADALAQAIVSEADRLAGRDRVPNTWPEVIAKFEEIFAPAVSTVVMQEVKRLFFAVVNKFTERAYDTGWREGNKRGNEIAFDAVLKTIDNQIELHKDDKEKFALKELRAIISGEIKA